MEEFEEIEVLGGIYSFKHVGAETAQVGITTGYALDGRVSIPGRGNIFPLTASIPALGPTQRPIQWVLDALTPELKRQGREVGCSPVSSVEVKKGRNCASTRYESS